MGWLMLIIDGSEKSVGEEGKGKNGNLRMEKWRAGGGSTAQHFQVAPSGRAGCMDALDGDGMHWHIGLGLELGGWSGAGSSREVQRLHDTRAGR